jgi:zinc D-Ala-D-Ala dipeptidase
MISFSLNTRLAFILSIFLMVECSYVLIDRISSRPLVKKLPLTFETIRKKNELLPKIAAQKDAITENSILPRPKLSRFEKQLMDSGFVDVKTIDSSIFVDLRYSSLNNFLNIDLYGDFQRCFLPKEVAKKLSNANKLLHEAYPYYHICILDGTRPVSVQQMMWDSLKKPDSLKPLYVAPPYQLSMHNYGAAVDVTLVNDDGLEMDMGTIYDFFGELGYPRNEERLVKEGKLTYRQKANRELLRSIMLKSGFSMIETEWWHFNYCSKEEAARKFKVIK